MSEAIKILCRNLGEARPGDNTLVDTLHPAAGAMRCSVDDGPSFRESLDVMLVAAESGWRSTEDMVAGVGRSSRLGERSIGYLDSGALSCFLMLRTMAETMKKLIDRKRTRIFHSTVFIWAIVTLFLQIGAICHDNRYHSSRFPGFHYVYTGPGVNSR